MKSTVKVTMKTRVLVTWLCHTDINLMAGRISGEVADLIRDKMHGRVRQDEGSPTKAILANEPFDSVHLLSNYGRKIDRAYEEWIGKPVTIHAVEVPDPTDYARVYQVTDELLANIVKMHQAKAFELCMHLSSGTHTMVAVLVLLGSTRYPATLYQSYKSNSCVVTLPFELKALLREQFLRPDQALARMAFRSPAAEKGFEAIVGQSEAILKAKELARGVATRNVPVLLLGESGVGKELFALAIHQASGRHGKFEAVNCAAIPPELLESELFGAAKGAGTGVSDREGHFKQADGGTLFLDEVGDLQPHHQAKLLRAVQGSDAEDSLTKLKLERVGEPGKTYTVDVRIVAATNRDLLVRDDKNPIRSDLVYRLSSFPIIIPPLRERGNDIKLIAMKLLERINRQASKTEPGFEHQELSTAANLGLTQYDWPGNVRQLNSVLLTATIRAKGRQVDIADIEQAIAQVSPVNKPDVFSRMREPGFELKDRLRLMEKTFIEDALREAGGVQAKAAKLLGTSPQTLNKRIERLGISITK